MAFEETGLSHLAYFWCGIYVPFPGSYLVASGDIARANIDPLRDKILTDSILES